MRFLVNTNFKVERKCETNFFGEKNLSMVHLAIFVFYLKDAACATKKRKTPPPHTTKKKELFVVAGVGVT
jgi:hypothetical protein